MHRNPKPPTSSATVLFRGPRPDGHALAIARLDHDGDARPPALSARTFVAATNKTSAVVTWSRTDELLALRDAIDHVLRARSEWRDEHREHPAARGH